MYCDAGQQIQTNWSGVLKRHFTIDIIYMYLASGELTSLTRQVTDACQTTGRFGIEDLRY